MSRLMLRKSNLPESLGIIIIAAAAAFALGFAITYGWTRAKTNSPQSPVSLASLDSDKARDGLVGSVSRVRTETAKLFVKSGKQVEGPRELMELTSYDPDGKRVDSSYYLVPGTSKTGREEYAYDDRGNIKEMTARDDNKSILSKEVYAYEYDAIGNWTKMITSRVIYEGDKIAQQPTDITYRNITYFFDQSIAEIAAPNSSPANEVKPERATEDLASLRSALNEWIAATNTRDIEKLMSFYDSRVDIFYLARNVSQNFVRAEKARLFARANLLDVSAVAPEITISPDERLATMRFRKPYFIKESRRIRQGEVIQQLRWQRTAEGWRIIVERDERVIR